MACCNTARDRAGHAARRRDREDREREQHEAAEREALKNMTEAERRAWEAAHPKVRCRAGGRPALPPCIDLPQGVHTPQLTWHPG